MRAPLACPLTDQPAQMCCEALVLVSRVGRPHRVHEQAVELGRADPLEHRLVDEGHTVIVIEHNLSIMGEADYIVDIGPEAGAEGGEVVATGTPEEIAKSRKSRTAPFLREVLKTKRPKNNVSSRAA